MERFGHPSRIPFEDVPYQRLQTIGQVYKNPTLAGRRRPDWATERVLAW